MSLPPTRSYAISSGTGSWDPPRSAPATRDRLVRSSLIAFQLLGFGLMRYVWQIEPVASMSEEKILAAIAPGIRRYIDDDISPP